MINSPIDTDEVLKQMASEAVKQSENLRVTVRDLTLKALHTRELSLDQIKRVLKSLTEGLNLGAAGAKIDVEKVFADAFAGMDDALLKAVQASQIALDQTTQSGKGLQEAHVKKALDDLERLEDAFLTTIRQTSEGANQQVRAQWATVLQKMPVGSTETGAQVAASMQQFGEQMQAAIREQRRASLKTADVLTQNFATLASGVLIGLTEALQPKGASSSSASKGRGS